VIEYFRTNTVYLSVYFEHKKLFIKEKLCVCSVYCVPVKNNQPASLCIKYYKETQQLKNTENDPIWTKLKAGQK